MKAIRQLTDGFFSYWYFWTRSLSRLQRSETSGSPAEGAIKKSDGNIGLFYLYGLLHLHHIPAIVTISQS
jgi:hypothetical protein